MVVETKDSSFEEDVLKSDVPVMVDFWAEWCGPCKQMMPTIEEFASEIGDKMKVVKVNIDENPDTPSKYGIRGVPTLMIFSGGELKSTKVGALPKSALIAWVKESI